MAPIFIFILLGMLTACQSVDNEFVYFSYHNSLSSNRTVKILVDEITDELRKIPEIDQLMHSWYRVFVRKDKVEFILRQARNIFKSFLVETFTSYLEEDGAGSNFEKDNRTLMVDLTLSLNKTHVAKTTELLNLLHASGNQTKIFKASCNTGKSLQQIFVDFYKTNLMNGSRNYFVMSLSFDDSELDSNQTDEFQPFELKKDSAMSTIIASLLSQVSRDVWRCDPEIHQPEVTYSSIESIHSIAMANTRMLGSIYSSDCDKYKTFDLAESLRVTELSARYGLNYSHDYTRLRLFDCQNVEPSASICLASPDSGSEDHRIIERPENCKNKRLVLLNKNHCVCSYTNLGTRQVYVNIAPIMADTDRNYVVTGARFKKDTDYSESMVVFNIEIQQGRLGPDGKVDQATVEWKTNKEFVWNSLMYHAYTISTLELEGTQDEVVVGLQFSDARGKEIFLRPLVKKFDLGTGQLSSETSSEIPVVDDKCKKSVNLKNADIPTLSKSPSYPESECAKVTFGPSSFRRDRGQTTVPYIDTQEVVTKPASALSGASLYYKSAKGYGGFVAIKLQTYNFAERLFP